MEGKTEDAFLQNIPCLRSQGSLVTAKRYLFYFKILDYLIIIANAMGCKAKLCLHEVALFVMRSVLSCTSFML